MQEQGSFLHIPPDQDDSFWHDVSLDFFSGILGASRDANFFTLLFHDSHELLFELVLDGQ